MGSGCVLIIDDESFVRAVAKGMLEAMGFTALAAEDGAEGLRSYRENRERVVLVILDLTMPRMDGEETLRRLRALDPGVRVIMTSGYSEQEATGRFAGDSVVGYIQKPFTLDDLTAQVRAALTRA